MCNTNAYSPSLNTQPDHLSSSSFQSTKTTGNFKKRSVSILDQVISFFCWIGRSIKNLFTAIYSRLISKKTSVTPKVNRYTPINPQPQPYADPSATKGKAATFKPATNPAPDNKSVAPDVPRAIFIVGGSGSGKSVLADQLIEKNKNKGRDYTLIDTDKIKENMSIYDRYKRGAKDTFKGNEIHNQARYQKDQLLKECLKDKSDIIYPAAGDNAPYLTTEINKFKNAGFYVKVYFVDTDEETCVARTKLREETTGRKVPESVVRRSNKLARTNFKTTFQHLAHTSRYYENNEQLKLNHKTKNDWSQLRTEAKQNHS